MRNNKPLGNSYADTYSLIREEYITDGKNVYGYHSGAELLNLLGLSTQVPAVHCICTNMETQERHEVRLGDRRVILSRPKARITAENVDTLRLLDIVTQLHIMDMIPLDYDNISAYDFFDHAGHRKALLKFIKNAYIPRRNIVKYAPLYPPETMHKLVVSGLIYAI